MDDPPSGTRSHIAVRDPRAMRALANPLRLQLLALLRRDGPHSVGELSTLADAAPGSVSYHLATLEQFGFVEQAPELARDGRERWWRAAHDSTNYEPAELLADPESAAAGRGMRQAFLQGHLVEQLALEAEAALPTEWVTAATSGDTLAYLTPAQLAELSAEVEALAEKWNRRREDAEPGAVPVRFIYSTFRQP
jgi:DNA-binding transcriptional ArsR family regulator